MPKYFDIHSHLDYADYGDDFEKVIENMEKADIGTISIGTDLESSKKVVALAKEHKNIWACVGIHPKDNHAEIWNDEEFEKLAQEEKVVAIGETGLDFFGIGQHHRPDDGDRGSPAIAPLAASHFRPRTIPAWVRSRPGTAWPSRRSRWPSA